MDSSPSERGPSVAIPNGLVVCAALATVACGAVMFLFDPARHAFYPVCLFHRLTGLNCPGCGGLRAVHQLLHGHVATAFRLNALVVLGAPAAAWLAMRWLRGWASGGPRPRFGVRPAGVWLMLAVLVVFGIARNLSFPALAQLSP